MLRCGVSSILIVLSGFRTTQILIVFLIVAGLLPQHVSPPGLSNQDIRTRGVLKFKYIADYSSHNVYTLLKGYSRELHKHLAALPGGSSISSPT